MSIYNPILLQPRVMPAAAAKDFLSMDNHIQRKCAHCEEEEKLLQKKENGTDSNTIAPPIVHDVINSSAGKPLDTDTRAYMEPRFNYDFSNVKIHDNELAAKSASSINALAYTSGNDIVFNSGQYNTNSDSGKRLLAHELTHVVQQSAEQNVVRRDIIDDFRRLAEAAAIAKLVTLANEPVGGASGFVNAGCPPKFCQPFASVAGAASDLLWAGPLILAGIRQKVNPRVLPLWVQYMTGGSGLQVLSSSFGSDFTASPTTADTTAFLLGELFKDVLANHIALMGSNVAAIIDFTPRFKGAAGKPLEEIDNPLSPNQMNFNFPADIAGNLVGGLGKDQTAHLIGARPSTTNDSREATVTATLVRNAGGFITIFPMINYTVKDTIDLCPGDCGTSTEQIATVPLSRFEATGLTGDVPVQIDFPAPPALLSPFVIPAPLPPAPSVPVMGTVTASSLNVRIAANTSSSIVHHYSSGTTVQVLCQVSGEVVDGSDVWYKTDKGFVSGHYISLAGAKVPATC